MLHLGQIIGICSRLGRFRALDTLALRNVAFLGTVDQKGFLDSSIDRDVMTSSASDWLKYPTQMSDKKNKRKPPISYRASKKAEEIIQEETKRTGLCRNAYIDMRITNAKPMRKSRVPSVDSKMLGELLVQATLLNQTLLNSDQPNIDVSDENITEAIVDIRNGIFLLLGRNP